MSMVVDACMTINKCLALFLKTDDNYRRLDGKVLDGHIDALFLYISDSSVRHVYLLSRFVYIEILVSSDQYKISILWCLKVGNISDLLIVLDK